MLYCLDNFGIGFLLSELEERKKSLLEKLNLKKKQLKETLKEIEKEEFFIEYMENELKTINDYINRFEKFIEEYKNENNDTTGRGEYVT